MFSIDANPNASVSAARNPRRRQRTGSDDSLTHRQNPKRLRRTRIASETFVPPSEKNLNGHTDHVDSIPAVNGHATGPAGHRDSSMDTASLVIRERGSKKVERGRRGGRSEGSVELVSPHLSQPACSGYDDDSV